jgi:uncharacterized membrane protein
MRARNQETVLPLLPIHTHPLQALVLITVTTTITIAITIAIITTTTITITIIVIIVVVVVMQLQQASSWKKGEAHLIASKALHAAPNARELRLHHPRCLHVVRSALKRVVSQVATTFPFLPLHFRLLQSKISNKTSRMELHSLWHHI